MDVGVAVPRVPAVLCVSVSLWWMFPRLKRTFDRLDRRIQRMEHAVTAREYDWERRMKETT